MWKLADIEVIVKKILAYIEGDDDEWKEEKRKKIILLTPEERAAQEARTRELMELIRRAEIELATGKRPPPDFTPSSA